MRKDNKYNHAGPSAEDRALEKFAEMMIEKISTLQSDWKKPWFTEGALTWPKNLSGREYNGMNAMMLMMHCEKEGFKLPVFCTFDRVVGLNYGKDKEGGKVQLTDAEGNELPKVSINKGSKSIPVFITTFTCVDKETKEKIKYDDYKRLSEEEKAKYNVYPKLSVYNVFNVDQTNLKEARPELYHKLEEQNQSQFKDGESFYSNLFHEMAHSTGAEDQLDRLKPTSFGSKEYSTEELKAEMTAALVSQRYGMTKHLKEDSAAYLKGWLESLKEEPTFIKTILTDVKKASQMITQKVDAIQLQLNKGVDEGKSESQPEQSKLKNLGTFDIPEWSLNYLENGDATNLTDEEVANVDAFTKEHFPNGFVMNIDFENSTELNRYPAFGPRNEEALTSKGESPFLATKTYPVTFYDARERESKESSILSEAVAAKEPPKENEAQSIGHRFHR